MTIWIALASPKRSVRMSNVDHRSIVQSIKCSVSSQAPSSLRICSIICCCVLFTVFFRTPSHSLLPLSWQCLKAFQLLTRMSCRSFLTDVTLILYSYSPRLLLCFTFIASLRKYMLHLKKSYLCLYDRRDATHSLSQLCGGNQKRSQCVFLKKRAIWRMDA